MPRRLIALYCAITVILAYPLSIDPARRVVSVAPDTDLFMWTMAWDAHALVTHPLHIFDANIYYPQARTLAYSENLIGSAIVAAPILWLTGNPVLAMNLVALLASVLCGIGACLLARRLGASPAAAALSGLVFAFAPPRFLRFDQLHLIAMQWIPFALSSLHAYLSEGRRRDAWLTVLFVTLQVLTSGHGAVFTMVAFALVLAWHVAFRGPLEPRRVFRDIGWPGVALAMPVLASMVPYLMVQREMGLRRTLEDWAVPASSFLASPTHVQVALLSLIPAATRINATAGAYLFPGFLPIVLALLAFVGPAMPGSGGTSQLRLRSRLAAPRVCYAALTLIALWLAAGPPIGLWPLVYWLPGLNFIRAPSRFVILGILGLAMLAAFGFDRLAARLSQPRWLPVLVGALLVAEFAASELDTEPYRVEIPAVDRWLATQPPPFAVAEVPLPDSRDLNRRERRQTLFMLHSMAHWQKTVHGYSGLRPPLYDELYRQLLRFPDEESLSALEHLGVAYVVVHHDLYEPDEWTAVAAKLESFSQRLRLAHEDPSGRVYALTRR